MPVFMDEGPVEPRLGAHGSLVIEIDWVLSAAHRRDHKGLRPPLEALYRGQPKLRDAVLSLWGPDETLSYPGHLELSLAAHHGGRLFSLEQDEVLSSLDELLAKSPSSLPLEAETPEDRSRLLRRLQVLRSSPKRRRRYVEVVGEVWAALGPVWEREGRPEVEAEVAIRAAELERGPRWEDFSRGTCKSPEALAGLVEPLGSAGELAVVPAWFAYSGLIVDLPGLVVVGFGTDSGGEGERVRSELLARRLKALADPTRLAILSALSRHELSVTELARRLGLSQPTVSNHMKLLREAGFVGPRGDGRSRNLAVQHEVIGDVHGELERLLTPGPG